MTALGRSVYQSSAALCASIVFHVPGLEQSLVRIGPSIWSVPWAGRFYRSVTGRYGQRLRKTGSQFRRVMVGDIPLVVDITEFTAGPLFFGSVPYEPKTAEYLSGRLCRGQVFVDVGANHGFFTVLGAMLVGGSGRVVAFEPNHPVCEQLRTHVRLNGVESRVTVIEKALSDMPDEAARFFVSKRPDNSGMSSLTPLDTSLNEGGLSEDFTTTVRADTFDRWFAASALPRVDVVKIDTEGGEAHVLRGMTEALEARRVGAIVCETQAGGAADRFLRGFGFMPRTLDVVGPLVNLAYEQPQ